MFGQRRASICVFGLRPTFEGVTGIKHACFIYIYTTKGRLNTSYPHHVHVPCTSRCTTVRHILRRRMQNVHHSKRVVKARRLERRQVIHCS
jgi:hypothetical protein